MLIEQIIFTLIGISLFVYIFMKMIKNKDSVYAYVLGLQAIGLLLNFIAMTNVELITFLVILKYLFAIVLPIAVIYYERDDKKLLELVNIGKAKMYLLLGNNKKAKSALTKITKQYPENYTAHKMLAEIYELEGGMRKAIDEYVQALDINKQDYDSYYEVANLLTKLDKKDEAVQMLESLLRTKPEYYKATELLGDLLIEKEMYKDAVNVYLDGLKHNPTSFELNYSLGIAYTMLNDFQSAETYYKKAAELNSLEYNTEYSLAEIALIYKELENAEMYFMKVLEVEDSDLEADAYFELAKINLIKGEKQKAVNYANLAVEIDPKKIVPKIKNEVLFIPVLAKINLPFNLDNIPDKPIKLKAKEQKAKEHLEETVDKTRTLGYNDIDLYVRNEKKLHKDLDKKISEYEKERE